MGEVRLQHRSTLANGLRVLLAPQPHAARVAVSVHYGVGFRSERPGWAGFAHLFEHLMFRGSENLPDGRFFEHVQRFGGQANGTTHQDYTDYYQVVPAFALEHALYGEADRMRAPRFTESALVTQLDGIEWEIEQAVHAKPYGGCPWPLLPHALFRRFANAHDGYGDMAQLRQATVDDCYKFFQRCYTPDNAVLTIVGAFDCEHALELVERHFARIPGRAAAAYPTLGEPIPAADNWVHCTEPATLPGVAIGQRIPDPETHLSDYLAHMVLAEMLNGLTDSAGLLRHIDATCGFFGPLDARDPDALVITGLVPDGESIVRVVDTVWERQAQLAQGDITASVARTVRAMAVRHRKEHAGLEARCRALGRLELLFGRAELLDELPELLCEIGPDKVASAARRLSETPRAVLALEPGPERTRPAVAGWDEGEFTATAPGRGRDWVTDSPDPPKGWHRNAPQGHEETQEAVLTNGLRLLAVQDGRAESVELRLRLPLGITGWLQPDQADRLAASLSTAAASAVREFGGVLTARTDGEWLDLSGHVPAGDMEAAIGVLAGLVDGTGVGHAEPVRVWPRGPERGTDDILRSRWLGGAQATSGPGADLPALHASMVRPEAACLVAVGDVDPSRLIATATRHMSGWGTTESACGQYAPGSWIVQPDPGETTLVVPAPGVNDVRVLRCVPEPSDGPSEAARYLATAVVGGYRGSRLLARSIGSTAETYPVFTGRDMLAATPRAYVRATVPRAAVHHAVRDIDLELAELTRHPPDATEVDTAREFCTAQLLGAFDSPSALADMLRRGLARGNGPDWPRMLPEYLRDATAEQVSEAAAALYPAHGQTTVLLGDVDREQTLL